VPPRRLEDRIRELCAKAMSTPESLEFTVVMDQLRASLREHAERMRKLAASFPHVPKRRQSDPELDTTKLLVKCAICGHPIALEVSKVNEEGDPVHEGCYVMKLRAAKSNSSETPIRSTPNML
jgi:hypothetical protein